MTNMGINEMKTVKAMVFTKGNNILTVVSAVPSSIYGKAELCQMRNGSFRPDSCGTFLYPQLMGIDSMVLRTPVNMTLSAYEEYLSSIGYRFCFTIKETRGKSVRDAFMFSRVFIRGYFRR